MEDHLIRVVSRDGLVRGAAAVTTTLVKDICARQETDLTVTVALGRLLTGGALLSCLLKGRQRLALMIEGNGPIGRMSVEADADGKIRGTVRNPVVNLPPAGKRFDVAGAIGRAGFLHVRKDLGLKDPYQSMVQLQTSEVGEDLAWYLASSEQVPSSLGLGVELNREGRVAVAGGFMIQSLPPGDMVQVERLIEKIQQSPPVTSLLKQGMSPADILAGIFSGVDFRFLQKTSLRFNCPCNEQQIAEMLIGLGATELAQLAEEYDPVEVVCEYCRKAYDFDRQAMERLIKKAG